MESRVPVIGHIVHCDRATPHRWELATIEALSRQTIAAGALPVVISDVEIEPTDAVLQALRRGVVDAVAVSAFSCRTPWVDEFVRSGMPVMMIGPHATAPLPFVAIDGRAAIESLVHHLAGQGRRRIGLIAGRTQRGDMASRVEGWRRGLAQAQLLQDDQLMIEGDLTAESGAMVGMSPNMDMKTSAGGLKKGLKRLFGGLEKCGGLEPRAILSPQEAQNLRRVSDR